MKSEANQTDEGLVPFDRSSHNCRNETRQEKSRLREGVVAATEDSFGHFYCLQVVLALSGKYDPIKQDSCDLRLHIGCHIRESRGHKAATSSMQQECLVL